MTKLLAVPLFVAALAGCPQLASMNTPAAPVAPPPRPEVKVSKVTLDARPTNARLAAYYCTQAAGGGIAGMACRVFGDVPRKDELKFMFRVELEAQNRATIAMPVASALVAFAAYPDDTGGQNLGSVCIEMCKDPSNCPQSANACDSSEPEIRGARDFAAAAAGFLISTALNGGAKVELTMPMVAPGTALTFVATLALDIDQMLALIKRTSRDALAQLTKGTRPVFQIPWAVEGSIWVRFEGFGRIGAGFPRQTGVWVLEQ